MPVTEEHIETWNNVKLIYKKNKYPVPQEDSLPRMYFVGLFVGSRGSGKTYSIVKLLKQYERFGIVDTDNNEQVAQRVVLFSPTVDANPVFTSLRNYDGEKDSITEYSDIKLEEIVDQVKVEREETLQYKRKLKLYNKFRKCKHIDELDHDELMELELMDFEPPIPPKYPNGCVNFFVFDDLIGSNAFKSTGKSFLTNLVLRNRHLGINILIATQSLKAIPKSIRTNTSVFAIFRYASKKIIIEDLYEEVSNLLTLEQFEELYEYCTQDQHDCLVVDFTLPKDERFKKNFEWKLNFSQ